MTTSWRDITRKSSIAIGFLALLVAVGLYIVQKQWNLYLQISLGLFVIGLMLFVALDPAAVRKALTGRQAKYGSNMLILTIAFLGILTVINYLVFKNNKQWDLTADQSNTLSKETLEVLNTLPDKVTAKAFYSTNQQVTSAKDFAKNLLDKYASAGKGKFEYEFINPNKDPVAAQDAGITKDAAIVLYMGNNKQAVDSTNEEGMTGAMLRLLNPGKHVLYFLTGHGEFPIDGTGDQSFSQLKDALEAKNYTVSSLNLIATPQVPPDASVIIIAGPQKPLTDQEVSLLDGYLKNGGSVVVMEEPIIATQFGDAADPLADYLAKTYGIVLGNNIVVDLVAAQSNQPFVAIANQYADHAITKNMSGMTSLYPTARSVTNDSTVGTDYTKTELVLTASQSWAETNMATIQDGSAKPDKDADVFGPVPLAVVAQGTSSDTRLVVIGDADFAMNNYFQAYGNGDIITNSIDWASKAENLISLSSKTTVERYMVEPKAYTMGLILLGSFVILPGSILVAGIATWLRRRKKG